MELLEEALVAVEALTDQDYAAMESTEEALRATFETTSGDYIGGGVFVSLHSSSALLLPGGSRW